MAPPALGGRAGKKTVLADRQRRRAGASYSLGDMIRAARLGYKWVPRWACFIRASIVDEYRSRLEAALPGDIPGTHTPGGKHVVWWEGEEDLMAMIDSPTLDRGIVGYTVVITDYDGKEEA